MQEKTRRKTLSRVLSAVCAFSMAATTMVFAIPSVSAAVNGDGNDVVNEAYAAHESLIPLPPGFCTDTVLAWTPASDPDAKYNRSTVPLETNRFYGPQANPLASTEAKLMSCSIANSQHDKNNTQGGDTFDCYAYSYWQYTESYVYWCGTEEGIFAIPTADITDAAHKNGVPVMATLGFPWGSGSGYVQEVDKFCQKAADGSFPVADKMIEIAEFYGFDGYFFNQESYNCSAEMASRMKEMILYMHRKAPWMVISWYDSMINTGGISYGNGLNSGNEMWMTPDSDGVVPVDQFFCNYNWYDSNVTNSINIMNRLGRSPFDVFFGLDVQQNGMQTSFSDHLLFGSDGKLRTSLALYCPNSTQGNSTDPANFHEVEQRFYVNAAGDPFAETSDPSQAGNWEWVGMARFFADRSVIDSAPFVTNFNTGHGKEWYVDGEASRGSEWNNRSAQEILPTWTWTVRSDGSKLKAGYDFDDAFNGGNSIKLTGNLDAENEILLYSTKIDNAASASLVYKAPAGVTVQLGVATGESYDPANFTYLTQNGSESVNGWTKANFDLSSIHDTIIALSVKVSGSASDCKVNLGQLSVSDGGSGSVSSVNNVTLDEMFYTFANEAEARVYWDEAAGASYYEVYRLTADGGKALINALPGTGLYISKLVRESGQTDVTLEVVPVDEYGVRHEDAKGTLVIPWGLPEDATEVPVEDTAVNICLGAKVIDVSQENASEPAEKAIDGTHLNGSKWCATNAPSGWMDIDVGEPKQVQRWRVEHAQYGGEDVLMNTIDFALEYKTSLSDSSWTEAKRIRGNSAAVTDVILDQPITAQYWRLRIYDDGSSPWGGIRIYEWQMFDSNILPQSEPLPMRYVTAEVNEDGSQKSKITFTHVPQGATVKIYSRTDPSQVMWEATCNSADGIVVFEPVLGVVQDGTRYFYTITEVGAGESCKMSFTVDGALSKVTPKAESVSFAPFTQTGSTVSSEDDYVYTTVTVNDLEPGDVVYVYEDGEALYTRMSLPVGDRETSVSIPQIKVARTGGKIQMQVKREGMKISEKYDVLSTLDVPAKQGSIRLYAYELGKYESAVENVSYDIYSGADKVGTVTADSPLTVGMGSYTAKCASVPAGYMKPSAEKTLNVTWDGQEKLLDIALESTGEEHNITISAMTNGTVTASKTSAAAGEEITVEVKPDSGYRLKDGTLKANSEAITFENDVYSFTMPNQDVTIYAEFELIPEGINGVTISPKTAAIDQFGSQQFTAVVDADPGKDTSVVWSFTTDATVSDDTTINGDGLFYAGRNSAGGTFTIKVASKVDPSKFDTATLTVNGSQTGADNIAAGATVLGSHGGNTPATGEEADKLFDKDYGTKWCVKSGAGSGQIGSAYVAFDVGGSYNINRMKAVHASGATNPEGDEFNTVAFELQVLDTDQISVDDLLKLSGDALDNALANDANWKTVKSYSNNTDGVTDDPVSMDGYGRIFRILVTDGDAHPSWKDTVRLYELELYGTEQSGETATVTAVEVTPETVTLNPGDTQQFTATVTGTGDYSDEVEWKVTGNTDAATTISTAGLLTVGANETAASLTVTATSKADAAKSDTAAVTVTLPPQQHNITVDAAMANGKVTANPTTAAQGTTVTLTVTPDTGYRLKAGSLKVNGSTAGITDNQNNTYSFTMPDAAVTVTAEFELVDYTIVIDPAITNGTVKVKDEKTTAHYGDKIVLEVIPDEGYILEDGSLKVDGNGIDGLTFDMPAKSVVVTAKFVKKPAVSHNVTVNNPANGTATVDKATAAAGEIITLTVKADAQYKLENIVINDGAIRPVEKEENVYTFTMPDEDVNIVVTFSKIETPVEPEKPVKPYEPATEYYINVVVGEHGTVTPGSGMYAIGSKQSFTIKPDAGYEIDSVMVDGKETGVNGGVLTLYVNEPYRVTVTFKEAAEEPSIDVSTPGSGSTTATQNPQTGDSLPVGGLLVAMTLAGGAVIALKKRVK